MSRRRNMFLFLFLVFALLANSSAQIFKKLAKFDGNDGKNPQFGVVQGPDGNFYGTTWYGGGNGGSGAVFRISPNGTLALLHGFNGSDGFQVGALTLASDGNFYGMTYEGGTRNSGTVFKINTKGELTTVHNFAYFDGAAPYGPLIQGVDGNLYGTTVGGGSGTQCGGFGCGTIFRMTLSGTLTTLYTFCLQTGCPDGAVPEGGLVQAKDGSFYGVTVGGGGGVGCSGGCGTVFNTTRNGGLTTLYRFCQQAGCPDGSSPTAKLTRASDGNFYGTTTGGDANGDYGTIFRLTPDGDLTTIHSFNDIDGAFIYAPLVQATDGYLYGVALQGGDVSCNPPDGCGTIFQTDEEGTVNVLHVFEGTDGYSPFGGLIQATSGIFYGTTYSGGGPKSDAGTVFGLSMGLEPFVSLPRDFGKVGAVEGILGQGLTGTTDVSFNGVPATFTVKSASLILATVPPGATTGLVTVTTSGGTLTSNVPFYVLH